MSFSLLFHTPPDWTEAVLSKIDVFLLDHATAEKKASGMAMSMVSHYPDRPELVKSMLDLAIEELNHYQQVIHLIYQRGLIPVADVKDPYVNDLRKLMRNGKDFYLLDRLLIAGIIEARGHERFSLVAEALKPGRLKNFYQGIAISEGRHKDLFIELAQLYFEQQEIEERLSELLIKEADIVKQLPIRPALH